MQFDPTLYVITDSTYHTTETLLRAVDEACRGGATLIQLREKDTGGRSYLELAQQVKSVTDRYSVPLIIDDRVDVAIACDAAGVHVGASDLPVAVCRRLLGPDKIVGATAKTVEAAVAEAARRASTPDRFASSYSASCRALSSASLILSIFGCPPEASRCALEAVMAISKK